MRKILLYTVILFTSAFYSCAEDEVTGPQFDPPSAPRTLSTQPGTGAVTLNWLQPDNIGGPFAFITEYRVYRSPGGTGGEFIASVSGQSLRYVDSSVVNGTTYTYTVAAVNEAGESPRSNQGITTPGTIPQAPLTPSAVQQGSGIFVDWDPPIVQNGTLVQYKVYRGNTGSPFAFYRTIIVPDEEMQDDNVISGIEYKYTISAVNQFGEGPQTDTVRATAP